MDQGQIEWGTLSPSQCKAARALLDWSQGRLATEASVGISTVADFERGQRTPVQNNLDAIRAALQRAGVSFPPGGAILEPRLEGGAESRPVSATSPPVYFNDEPIKLPQEDRFGMAPFARALAQSFREMQTPIGSSVALTGPWGSGKSSAANLVRHYLEPFQADGKLEVLDFQCWWFRGEEALTIAFLQALHAALDKTLGQKARELIPKIGKKLLQAGPVLGPTVDLATGGVGGTLIEKSLDFTRRYFSDGESVEGLFWRLSDALARQDKRYLVIIDDIDRLAPDEALLVFRLVKSVGRLPNVMYLLLFDRTLAEMTVQERYPSEGPHFLEKIIQATFELPLPAHDDLYNSVLAEIEERCGAPQEAEIRRFMNLFYDAVAPYIRKPRDVVRLTNAISVTWPSVEGEVNLADFVSLETLRVFEPNLYNAIRTNKPRICGIRSEYDREDQDKTIEKLLENVPLSHRESATNALKRLFPRLENVGYGPDFADSWNAQRLVCSKNHFDTYFRLSVGDETLPAKEIDTLIENCGDPDYVKNAFRKALDIVRKSGKSKVPLLLDELNVHASRIERQKFEPLISGLFAVADDINRESDKERGFSIGDNHLRIHWLIRKLTFERCDLHERSKIFVNACKQAQVGWLVDFTTSAIGDYYPREGQEPEPPEKCLVEKDQVSVLRTIATEKINEAAANGSLIKHPQLAYILYRWRDKFCDGDDIVKAWTKLQLSDDVAVALFARAFTGESLSQGMGMFGPGDHVAVRHTKAAVKSLELLMDVDQFRRRLDELEKAKTLPKPYQAYVEVLLEAWRRRDRGEDRDW